MTILNNLVIRLLRFTGTTNLAEARRSCTTNLPNVISLVVTVARRLYESPSLLSHCLLTLNAPHPILSALWPACAFASLVQAFAPTG
jgi:hypothetical protein